MDNRNRSHYRSLFWPVILIGVGVVWLLGNLGMLSGNALNLLAALWPLLLVGIGLDLLFGRSRPLVGALIALILLGGVIFLLVSGSALGVQLPGSGDFKVEQFSTPLDGAKSAQVTIESASQPVEIKPLAAGGDLLLDATIGHYGQMQFDVSGGAERQILLRRKPSSGVNFGFEFRPDARWDIRLAPGVPYDLRIDSASGSTAINLEGLMLSRLSINSGSGSVAVVLPASSQAYEMALDSGSGAIDVQFPADTPVRARFNSGSGSLRLQVPRGAALRVEVQNGGSGSINLPGSLTRISGDSGEDEGVWESSGYSSAKNQIEIILEDVGSGSVRVQ